MSSRYCQQYTSSLEEQEMYSACTESVKLHLYGVDTVSSNEEYHIDMKSRFCVLCRRKGIVDYPLIWANFSPRGCSSGKTKWKPICSLSPDQIKKVYKRDLIIMKFIVIISVSCSLIGLYLEFL